MTKGKRGVLIVVILCFAMCAAQSDALYGQNRELTAAELVAKHLNAIAKPDLLTKVKSREMSGDAAVQFIQGFPGQLTVGQFLCASEGQGFGMQIKFNDTQYPGEYFAYNGKEVSVGSITPEQNSPIADFVFRYTAIMKEGLLGGVLSVTWPLLKVQERQTELVYKQEKVEERTYYVLEYGSRKNLGDSLKVKLYFDPETYRHVRTEYSVRLKPDMTSQPSINAGMGPDYRVKEDVRPRPDGLASTAAIQDSQPDSIYVMVEKFGNFANIGGLMLPQDYSIYYSAEGSGVSFIARWAVMIERWIPNKPVDPNFFVAQK